MKLSGHVTQPHMIVAFLVNDVSRMCRQLTDRKMREVGLTRAQWFLLNYVLIYDGLSQQELADLSDLPKSNVAVQIRTLEAKGWVSRGPHETDGRSFRVYLTEEMKPIIRKLNDVASMVLKDTLSKISEKEVKHLIIMLKSIDLQLEAEFAIAKPTPKLNKLIEEIRQDLG